ncbi:uncharacterized protein LOC135690293 [Rhopilema esculentum]|uniref:uncharacterized protein LOC135690293 n=1 Tax=Rhopilema esculentum TaxID=499914 RepID=UPI0031E1EA4A
MTGEIQRGHSIGALVIGIMELLFGLIIVICSFVLGGKVNVSAALTPYWAGIPYVVPGILGIVVGATKNKCAMIAFMILNIICFIINGIASILIFVAIGVWAGVAAEVTSNCNYLYGHCVCRYNGQSYSYKVDSCDTLTGIVALLWAIVVFALIAAITTLAGSILGCISSCCSQNQTPGVVVIQQGQMPPPNYKA